MTVSPTNSRPRAGGLLERGTVTALSVLFALGLCGFLFARMYTPTVLTRPGMERVEAARRFATTGDLATYSIHPLALRYVRANPDASIPDVYQAPLFSLLAGTGIRLAHHLGPNQGDKVAVAFTLLCFAASTGACWLLARRLFGPGGALLAALFYLLGANALSAAVTPGPMPLVTALFALLLVVLVGMDVSGRPLGAAGGEGERRASVVSAVGAGALWGLMFLALYSSLLLLPVLLAYLWRVTRRDLRVLAAFLAVAALMAAPVLLRGYRLTGNPLFHLRLFEIVMHTPTFPGDSLYRTLGLDQPVFSYLAGGGGIEVVRKAMGNVAGYLGSLPISLGLVPFALFVASALTRFAHPAVNRLRGMIYAAFALHILGLSLFFPYGDGLPILLMYLPIVCVLGTAFFLNFVRARDLPPFSSRLVFACWTAFACLPGTLYLLTSPRPQQDTLNLYGEMSRGLPKVKEYAPRAVFAADVPWEAAYRLDAPALWLPANSNEFRDSENFLGAVVTNLTMSPVLETAAPGDPAVTPWRLAYRFITSFYTTQSTIEWQAREELARKMRVSYSPAIAESLMQFVPQAVPEAEGRPFSVIWWRRAGLPPRQ